MKFKTKIGSQRNTSFQEFFTIEMIRFNLTKIRKKMLMSKIGQPIYHLYFFRLLNRIKFRIFINITVMESGKFAYAHNPEYV
jgi:hypothetical protein